MNDGEHQVEWNAADMNAGVYFLRMQTNNLLETEKKIIIQVKRNEKLIEIKIAKQKPF